VLRMTPALREAVDRGTSGVGIRSLAASEGMAFMCSDGLRKARLGLTTLEEVLRVVAVQAAEGESPAANMSDIDIDRKLAA